MLRSLFSGVTGLNIHQTQMDVIGNNLANVNSNAYKSQRTNFADIFYQEKQNAMGPTERTGSLNPIQIGLGGRVASINKNVMSQGSALTTDAPFDMMIEGDSFFVVGRKPDEMFYTRDGSFLIDVEGAGGGPAAGGGVAADEEGYLVTSSLGYYVLGWQSEDGETVNKGPQLQPLRLYGGDMMESPGEPTTQVKVTGNIDRTDPKLKDPDGIAIQAAVIAPVPDEETGEIEYPTINANFTLKPVTNDAGEVVPGQYTLTLEDVTDSKGRIIAEGTGQTAELTYDQSTGDLSSAPTANFQIGDNNVTFDFTYTHTYYSGGLSTIHTSRGDLDGNGAGQNDGVLTTLTVSRDGKISANYTNGDTRLLGQVATATFMNATGLVTEGDNLYSESNASGRAMVASIDEVGDSIRTGALEGSNVDLADEFTRMITTQRGFQANSRVITTSDSMLQELKQMKR